MLRDPAVFLVTSLSLLPLAFAACSSTKQPSRERRVDAGDVELHVRVVGDPSSSDVLIAIHGGPGMSSDYMASVESLAGPELALVTYDQRGAGRSGKPAGGYTFHDYVADLEAVRCAVGAERVHLLGHSWGGLLALKYATINPDRVRSIVLAGSGAPDAESARAGQARMARRVAELQAEGVIPRRVTSPADLLPAYFSNPALPLPVELQELSYNGAVEQQTWATLGDYDFAADVGRLEHRVLLLWGRDDPFGIDMAQATLSALALAQVEYVLLERCGHFWQECPEPFFSQVRALLNLPGGKPR